MSSQLREINIAPADIDAITERIAPVIADMASEPLAVALLAMAIQLINPGLLPAEVVAAIEPVSSFICTTTAQTLEQPETIN